MSPSAVFWLGLGTLLREKRAAMMRHVIFLALVGASFAANNVLQCTSGCDWYTSASSWSLSRFPRTGDSSIVNADTKFADNAPAYMVGASQGAELRVDRWTPLDNYAPPNSKHAPSKIRSSITYPSASALTRTVLEKDSREPGLSENPSRVGQ